jgi:four helix bundle protein
MKDVKYRAYYFAVRVLKYVGRIKVNGFYAPMTKQVARSATSIGANIVEGRSGSSTKDMINYYNIALKSANETKYWLCLMRDTLEIKDTELNQLIKEANEISKILATIILKLKAKISIEKVKIKS